MRCALCISWAWGRSTRLSLPRVIWCDLALSWSAKQAMSSGNWMSWVWSILGSACMRYEQHALSASVQPPPQPARPSARQGWHRELWDSSFSSWALPVLLELARRAQMWSRWSLATIKNRTFYPVQSFLQQSLITYWKVLVAFNQNCSLNSSSLEVHISTGSMRMISVDWRPLRFASQIIFFYWLRLRDFPRQAIVPTLDQLLVHSQCPEQSRQRQRVHRAVCT